MYLLLILSNCISLFCDYSSVLFYVANSCIMNKNTYLDMDVISTTVHFTTESVTFFSLL